MRTSVVMTIDVEADIAGGIESYSDGFRPVIDQQVACNIDGHSEGLGFIIRTLRERGLRATFFVEAAQANYFGPAAMGRYVDLLLSAAQDVQLHVHPCWFSYHNGVPDLQQLPGDSCAALAEPVLEDFFARSIATFRDWTGGQPLAVRTGSFRTGRNVYRVMKRLGIPLSSNLCIGLSEPAEPDYRLPGGCRLIEGVREYPLTSFLDRRGLGSARFRPLQVRSCSSLEMIAILDGAQAAGYETVVILTHPFEFVKSATEKNRNAWTHEMLITNRTVRARLRRLCDYLVKHEERFEVCTFADLASRPPTSVRPVRPLHGSPVLSWLRTLENGFSDRVKWL
ncbi:hypothetical protein [Candidatus Thiodictyon syntrophicum]|nr:hypothetical protein [Candidatus Thiodictyon syntrophicum]